jgi:hypothetical protein
MTRAAALIRAHAAALQRWQSPFHGFTSGHDPRSSDAALMVLTYGGLVHAARHEWLNAGRRLIDRTYIDILWHVQHLTAMRACRAEQIAAALDGFIRDRIAPLWDQLPGFGDMQKAELSKHWVADMAQHCFGSLRSELAASRLLFFLCPMLPLFNLSRGHLWALEQQGHSAAGDGYHAFADAALGAYQELTASLRALPRPTPSYGDPAQQASIQVLLSQGDWWDRRVFDELLRQTAADGGITEQAFGCNAGGQMMH